MPSSLQFYQQGLSGGRSIVLYASEEVFWHQGPSAGLLSTGR